MVLRGQYLERPALIACGDVTLEGLYHRGRRAPALLCCPPLEGGGMDAPVLAELAWACARAGYPSLRFQHRGVGASTGARDPARALEDAEAALDHLAATTPGGLAVAGYGTGCRTALALLSARPDLRACVLIDPRVGGSPFGAPDGGARAARAVPEGGATGAGAQGAATDGSAVLPDGARAARAVPDGAGAVPDGGLSETRLLLVLPQEGVDAAGAAVPHLAGRVQMLTRPAVSRIEVIAGADAMFRQGLPAVGRVVVGFLRG